MTHGVPVGGRRSPSTKKLPIGCQFKRSRWLSIVSKLTCLEFFVLHSSNHVAAAWQCAIKIAKSKSQLTHARFFSTNIFPQPPHAWIRRTRLSSRPFLRKPQEQIFNDVTSQSMNMMDSILWSVFEARTPWTDEGSERTRAWTCEEGPQEWYLSVGVKKLAEALTRIPKNDEGSTLDASKNNLRFKLRSWRIPKTIGQVHPQDAMCRIKSEQSFFHSINESSNKQSIHLLNYVFTSFRSRSTRTIAAVKQTDRIDSVVGAENGSNRLCCRRRKLLS